MVGEGIQSRVDPDMGGGIDQRTGSALDLGIVALARQKLGHLLHVCFPVYLGICHELKSASASKCWAQGLGR